jgi:hypothetical protein
LGESYRGLLTVATAIGARAVRQNEPAGAPSVVHLAASEVIVDHDPTQCILPCRILLCSIPHGTTARCHMKFMFVETDVFTRRMIAMELDGALRWLQATLEANPSAGSLEAGTGGLRKLRMAHPLRGKGKRGGARVLYLYRPTHDVIYLLLVYGKDEMDALSHRQRLQLLAVTDALKAE